MVFNKWKALYEEAQEEIEELEESVEELEESIEELEETIEELEEELEKVKSEKALLADSIDSISTVVDENDEDEVVIKKLKAQLVSSEIAHKKLIQEKDETIDELKTTATAQHSLPTEEEIEKIDKAELISLVLEMKTRLEVAETFETIQKTEEYLEEFALLFKFSDLIQAIEPDFDFPQLLQQQKKKALKKVNSFLPVEKQVTSTKEVKTNKENLKDSLELRRKEMRNKVDSLGLSALFNDHTLKKYFILSKVKGGYSVDTFISFDEHETILIPETFCGKPIVKLQKKLFYNCKSIKNIVIAAPITILPTDSFSHSSLETVVLPDTIELFEGCGMFWGTLISEIALPTNLKVLPAGAFDRCRNLKTVLLNDKLEEIGRCAFQSAPFSEITLPDSLQKIDESAFANTQLAEITIPKSVTHIDRSAFEFCYNIVYKCYAGSYAQKWAREHGFTIKNAEEDE